MVQIIIIINPFLLAVQAKTPAMNPYSYVTSYADGAGIKYIIGKTNFVAIIGKLSSISRDCQSNIPCEHPSATADEKYIS